MAKTFQTPLRRARGSGSAHEGAGHFWAQRLTAVLSIFLTIFILILAIALAGRDYASARALIANPLIAAGVIATAGVFVWHMMIGMQVIIEDYVHGALMKPALLMANIFFSGLVFILAAVAAGKIAFGA
jgi:succinate dehydrogenase / fumarate reductase membrane anchor subunit